MWIVSIALLTMLSLSIRNWLRTVKIKHWYNTLDLNKHHQHYKQLFAAIDGFALSREARINHDAIEYTYGEIDFISFIALLSLTNPSADTVFYDLGSGTGKAVLACAMVFNVQKSCGIELFNLLHDAAVKQRRRLNQLPDYHEKSTTIHLINADFLNTSFSDATLIFINATTFFGDNWIAISKQLEQIKLGAIVITTSKKLRSDVFALKKITTVQMSWGPVNAYIQQRV